MQTVNREALLNCLESVAPGVSSRDIVEQSSCFIIKKGRIISFNEEVACSMKTELQGTGAVQATPLLNILRKLPEETIEVEVGDGELRIKGARKWVALRMDKEILLPIDKIEKPGEWTPLAEDFVEAVNITQHAAGKDHSKFTTTCLHFHRKWIEACDNFQMTRFQLKTGIDKACLVRKDTIRHIIPLGMTEMSETDSWLHFRNATGLVVACRRHIHDYPNLSGLLSVEGEPISLPKGLVEATDRANIFSGENKDENEVEVQLRPGKLRIRGEGSTGWYAESKEISYNGPELTFRISPTMLSELTQRHTNCLMSPEFIKVDGGKFVFVACLSVAPKESEAEAKRDEGGSDGDQDQSSED